MARRDNQRILLLGLIFLLLSMSILPAVAAQRRRSSDPTGEFLEPFKEALTIIVDIFRLDWLDNDAASYQAVARFATFIVMFVLIRQALARLGHISPKGANVIAFAMAFMGVVFMPDKWLTGMGVSYAAVFTMIPILFIAYTGFRVARTSDTSHPSERLRFIFIYLILIALLVFIAMYMSKTSTNQKILNVEMDILIWGIYAITIIYLVLSLFTKGFGISGGVSEGAADWSKDDTEKKKKKKKEAKTVKATEKAEKSMREAGSIFDALRRFGHRQVNAVTRMLLTDEMDLQEIKRIIKDITIGLETIQRERKGGSVQYHDETRAFYRMAISDARKHLKTLKGHLRRHKRTTQQHRRLLVEESQLIKVAKRDEKSAYHTLEDRKGQLNKYIQGEDADPAVRPSVLGLEKQVDGFLKENKKITERYEQVLTSERDVLRRIKRGLSKMEDKLSEVEDILKGKTTPPEDLDKAIKKLGVMYGFYRDLIQEDRVVLTYSKEKEVFEGAQENIEAKALKITDEIEKLILSS